MRPRDERGAALISALLIMMLMSALLVGFITLIASDQRTGLANRDQTQAYAAAHAGLEKLTSEMGQLFAVNYAPTCADINALTAAAQLPVLPGVSYTAPGGAPGSGYAVTFSCPSPGTYPAAENTPRQITAGPFSGFQGLITPYEILVTASYGTGSEVRMKRQLETVAIPVFQFGVFSDNDLSFFAGPNFNFGGRVHTNGNLFVAEGDGNTLTLADRVTVYGEVIRKNLSNGWLTSSSYTGTVNVAYNASSPPGTTAMSMTSGSWNAATPQLPSAPNGVALTPTNDPTWTTFSVTTTKGFMKNGRTGAKRLDLPLVQMGALPIDLIRRPLVNSNENTANEAVFGQRYFSMASLRILLSDTAADLTGLPSVDNSVAPVDLTTSATNPPLARAPTVAATLLAQNYKVPAQTPGTPLVTGFIKIEMQRADSTWTDVTMQILNLGFAGRNLSNGTYNTPDDGTCYNGTTKLEPNPNAIIRLQRLRDVPATMLPCGSNSITDADYWPNVLYDAREGLARDTDALRTDRTHYLGGIIHYIELDVKNLSTWMAAQGANIMQETGYVVYFSDRRGNWHDPAATNQETAEYGFEDVVNPTLAAGWPPPNAASYPSPPTLISGLTPDTGEDFNGDTKLQVYGATPITTTWSSPLDGTARPWTPIKWNYSGAGTDYDTSKSIAARVNPPLFFRRALKIVNGQKGNIIAPGLTITSENPVYLQGNYNADSGGFGAPGDGHRACAIIADSVTLLSNEWNDINSFLSPHDPGGTPGRRATGDAWYRVAIVAGKGLSFPQPTGFPTYRDFGTDGGAHNFLRFLESWSSTLNYRGSIVSFFTSRQNVGTYKCCNNVYSPPTRGYNFDTEFLTPSLLPPRTPMFRDVNVLTFRQILRATQ